MNRVDYAASAAAHDWCNDSPAAAQEQEGSHSGNSCSTCSRNDIYGHDTVSTASRDAASLRETYNLEDWTVQGLLHSYDSGNLERAGGFFTWVSNDGGNNNDPLLVAALPPSTAMNVSVNLNGTMDSPRLVATAPHRRRMMSRIHACWRR